MENQVHHLEQLNIPCAMLTSRSDEFDKKRVRVHSAVAHDFADAVAQIEKDMLSGHPKIRLLYGMLTPLSTLSTDNAHIVTPERLAMRKFIGLLDRVYKQGELARLVIDEAHCISEWGYNFRQEYQQLGNFRVRYEKVPIMALTASATKK